MVWPKSMVMSVVGATGMIAQVLLMRELLVCFFGNELALGLILAGWLLTGALGSWLAGRSARPSADRNPRPVFNAVVIISALVLPLAIMFVRLARPLFRVLPGEVFSLPAMAGIALLALLPVSLLHGALFTLGVSQYPDKQAAGKVYVFETLGSILGGAAIYLLLFGRVGSLAIALLVVLVNLGVVALAAGRQQHWLATAIAGGLLALTLTGLFTSLPDRLDRVCLERQYPGRQVLYFRDSHYGNITVLERAGQFTVLEDGVPGITVPEPDYALVENFVHIPVLAGKAMHNAGDGTQRPEFRVLLLGSGLGGNLRELLKYPDVQVDYCELDPALPRVARRVLPESTRREIDSPRVRVRAEDGRLFLKRSDGFDLILVSHMSPATLQSNRYFTQEFFALAQSRLSRHGLLAVRAPGSVSGMSLEMAALNRQLQTSLQAAFPCVRGLPGDVNLYLASKDSMLLRLDPERLAQQLQASALELHYLTPAAVQRRMAAHWPASDWEALKATAANTDRRPIGVLNALALWLSVKHRQMAGGLLRLTQAGQWVLPGLIVVFFFVVVWWRRSPSFAGGFAMFSTGLAAAATSLLALLLVQVASGALYVNLALLSTSAMAGNLLGATAAGWRLSGTKTAPEARFGERAPALPSRFYVLEGAVGITGLLLLLVANSGLVLLAVVAGLGGCLVGAEYPQLVNWAAGPGKVHGDTLRQAGRLYALDLLGGVVGALVVPLLLVPVIGMLPTAMLVAVLKLGSIFLLALSR
jgi:spermidine synthase